MGTFLRIFAQHLRGVRENVYNPPHAIKLKNYETFQKAGRFPFSLRVHERILKDYLM